MTDKIFYNHECIGEFPKKSIRLNIGDKILYPITLCDMPEPAKVYDITIQESGEAHIYVK